MGGGFVLFGNIWEKRPSGHFNTSIIYFLLRDVLPVGGGVFVDMGYALGLWGGIVGHTGGIPTFYTYKWGACLYDTIKGLRLSLVGGGGDFRWEVLIIEWGS